MFALHRTGNFMKTKQVHSHCYSYITKIVNVALIILKLIHNPNFAGLYKTNRGG